MTNIHLCFGGPTRKILDRKCKTWRFEDHPYCGPTVVDRNDDPKDVQPPESSPFWEAVNCWYAQGKQMIDNGFCKWQPPTVQKMKHIGGRHYELVP